jgi:hypothetical protein
MTRKQGRFYFAALARSHVRMYSGAVKLLQREGFDCRCIDLDDVFFLKTAKPAFADEGLSSISLVDADAQLEAGDILVVANDWVPAPLVQLLNGCRQRGIVAVGCIDGCRFAKDNNYRNVDHVLGWGSSCLQHYPQTGIVVGSPEIEAAWQSRPQFADPPFAAVNYKFTYHRQAGREQWTDIVRKACAKAGVAARFSRHPADKGQDPLNLPTEEMSVLLRDASLLISRPSTTIYHAMAAGKPVVFLPTLNEELVEFSEPMGAYEVSKSRAELVQMIRQALDERASYRERCRAFFERHVSIDPKRPAAERMAAALRDINRGTDPS